MLLDLKPLLEEVILAPIPGTVVGRLEHIEKSLAILWAVFAAIGAEREIAWTIDDPDEFLLILLEIL